MNFLHVTIRLHTGVNTVDFEEAKRKIVHLFAFSVDEQDSKAELVISSAEMFYVHKGSILRADVLIATFRFFGLVKTRQVLSNLRRDLSIPDQHVVFTPENAEQIAI